MPKPKFKKGDICRCSLRLKKGKINLEGVTNRIDNRVFNNNCQVRIISSHETINGFTYNVYNITFDRYEKIGQLYLKLDVGEMRNRKINDLLD